MSVRLQLDLPPTPNQAYRVFQSRVYMTSVAKQWKKDAAMTALAAKFRPDIKKRYAVGIWLFLPHWDTMDIDAVKLILDAVIGERIDHRVVSLMVHKHVQKPPHGCVMRIREVIDKQEEMP